MTKPIFDLVNDIDMTAAALDDLSSIMVQSSEAIPGANCLYVLSTNLICLLAQLWEQIKQIQP